MASRRLHLRRLRYANTSAQVSHYETLGIVLAASVVATLIVSELTARLAYGVQERHREADMVSPDMPSGNLA